MPSGRFAKSQHFENDTVSLIDEVSQSGEPCYITQDGKAKAVLMDINRYNALMDLVEESESLRERDVGDETREVASVRVIIKRHSTRKLRTRR